MLVIRAFAILVLAISGCKDMERGKLLKSMFQTKYFRIVVVEDEQTVEVCGALKVWLFWLQEKVCPWKGKRRGGGLKKIPNRQIAATAKAFNNNKQWLKKGGKKQINNKNKQTTQKPWNIQPKMNPQIQLMINQQAVSYDWVICVLPWYTLHKWVSIGYIYQESVCFPLARSLSMYYMYSSLHIFL